MFSFITALATSDTYPSPYTTLFRSPPVLSSACSLTTPQWLVNAESLTSCVGGGILRGGGAMAYAGRESRQAERSEEHTSELQSRPHLVCRLLLEKKKADSGRPD